MVIASADVELVIFLMLCWKHLEPVGEVDDLINLLIARVLDHFKESCFPISTFVHDGFYLLLSHGRGDSLFLLFRTEGHEGFRNGNEFFCDRLGRLLLREVLDHYRFYLDKLPLDLI